LFGTTVLCHLNFSYPPSFVQGEQDVDSSVESVNNESNQPNPMSVLEGCFSNDTSSSGSPVEKNGKHFIFLAYGSRCFYYYLLDQLDFMSQVYQMY
jgi:hypothetical protein